MDLAEIDSNGKLITHLVELTAVNTEIVVRLNAQVIALTGYLDASLENLSVSQMLKTERSFRRRMDEVLGRTDDIPMRDYSLILLGQINSILDEVRRSRLPKSK